MVVCHWYKTERDLECNEGGNRELTYSERLRMRNHV